MAELDIRPLSGDHPFGARISGVTLENAADEDVRQTLRDVFWDRGMIIFEDMEPSDEMQLAVSNVFGPSQDYAIRNVKFEDSKNKGLIHFTAKERQATVVEFGGRQVAAHVPWHFDACYVPKLNRAGVLRVVSNAPEDGRTGFADGIQLYQALSPEWRAKAEKIDVIYWQYNMDQNQRFAMPEDWKLISLSDKSRILHEASRDIPRSVHPAVWTRETGEKVLHVCPWQADGIAGMEGPEGDALLEELIQEMLSVIQPYWHEWKPTDMAIWDNWRFIHSAGGYPPQYARDAQRTTIQGDYGLGSLLDEWEARAAAPA